MKVIEHRINLPSTEPITPYAEIDVQLGERGLFLVRHDITDSGPYLFQYLRESKHESFLVNVKQSLSITHLSRLIEEMGDRLIGLFDVPWPLMYYASNSNYPVYCRISQYEPPNWLTCKYWLDPLGFEEPGTYNVLYEVIRETQAYNEIMVCCPSLHHYELDKCKEVWEWMKDKEQIQGIVTKYAEECREYFNA